MSDDHKPRSRIARYKPYYFKPVPGKTYLWCRCGLSNNQPFCDGSHKGTALEPVKYIAAENDTEVLLCGCKQTNLPPFCDGSHNNLQSTYEMDDPQSESNRNKVYVAHHRDGRFELNGDCSVGRVSKLPVRSEGIIHWSPVVTSETGSKYQAMFFMEIGSGVTPVIAFGSAEVILFVTNGRGEIDISGRTFSLQSRTGIYIRKGETFVIKNAGPDLIAIYVSVCPQVITPSFNEIALHNFDSTEPQRVVAVDFGKKQSMGDRAFQLLVSKEIGSQLVTQFIGTIPYSKAAPHRHLYEEALIILTGHGMIWTEDLKTKVAPGDVVFLPGKQMHSLQCSDVNGMEIVGVIYPGGNPDINY